MLHTGWTDTFVRNCTWSHNNYLWTFNSVAISFSHCLRITISPNGIDGGGSSSLRPLCPKWNSRCKVKSSSMLPWGCASHPSRFIETHEPHVLDFQRHFTGSPGSSSPLHGRCITRRNGFRAKWNSSSGARSGKTKRVVRQTGVGLVSRLPCERKGIASKIFEAVKGWNPVHRSGRDRVIFFTKEVWIIWPFCSQGM